MCHKYNYKKEDDLNVHIHIPLQPNPFEYFEHAMISTFLSRIYKDDQ